MAHPKEPIIKELDKMHIAKDHGNLHFARVHCMTANKMIDVLFADHYPPNWAERAPKYRRKVELH